MIEMKRKVIGVFDSVRRVDENSNVTAQIVYYSVVGILFVLFIHGYQGLYVLLAALINYSIGRLFGQTKWNPVSLII